MVDINNIDAQIENIDQLPVIYGLLQKMNIQATIDKTIQPYGNWPSANACTCPRMVYRRNKEIVPAQGQLVEGDSKMGALPPRAFIVSCGDHYLTPLAHLKDEPNLFPRFMCKEMTMLRVFFICYQLLPACWLWAIILPKKSWLRKKRS